MRRVHWIRNKMLGALALAVALVLALTSCSLFDSQQDATGAGPTDSPTEPVATGTDRVDVAFPGRDDLQAEIEPVEQTQTMTDALPNGAPVHDLVDLSVANGEFPDTGATVSFDLDQQPPEGAHPTVVHWNEETSEWEPLPSELSADGKTLSAHVEHFSIKGRVEGVYNWLDEIVGNAGDAPTCPGSEPEWSDVQFFDDRNAPLLMCVGTDQKNPDILEVRAVANRSSAMLVSTTITPEWAWSDVLGDTGPETWIGTVLGGEPVDALMTSRYLIPPGGEYRFGFAKEKLFELWRTVPSGVLIEAETSGASVVGGLVYSAVADHAGGKVGAAVSLIALAECGYSIDGLGTDATGEATMSAFLSCLNGQRGAIVAEIEKEVGESAKDAVKWIKYAAAYYILVKGTLSLGAIIGDAALPRDSYRMTFTPSLAYIDEAVGRSGQTDTLADLCGAGCTPGGEATVDHPTWGMVRIVTLLGADLSQPSVIAAVDDADKVLWSAEASGLMYLAPADTTQDATGNVFLNFNPGRYNGVIVLTPTADGFDDLGSLPNRDDKGRFYFASLGEGADGQSVIWKFYNDCDPTCAGGRHEKEKLEWDGNDYTSTTGRLEVTGWPDEDYDSPS